MFHVTMLNAATLQYHYTDFEIFPMEALILPHGIAEHQMHIMNFLSEPHLDL